MSSLLYVVCIYSEHAIWKKWRLYQWPHRKETISKATPPHPKNSAEVGWTSSFLTEAICHKPQETREFSMIVPQKEMIWPFHRMKNWPGLRGCRLLCLGLVHTYTWLNLLTKMAYEWEWAYSPKVPWAVWESTYNESNIGTAAIVYQCTDVWTGVRDKYIAPQGTKHFLLL